MCNRLHEDSHAIPKAGTAWKIFRHREDGSITGPFSSYTYTKSRRGWTTWNEEFSYSRYNDIGFCAFPTKEEAVRCLDILNAFKFEPHYYQDCFVVEVKYQKGLGGHKENHIHGDYTFDIVIFKKFKMEEPVFT